MGGPDYVMLNFVAHYQQLSQGLNIIMTLGGMLDCNGIWQGEGLKHCKHIPEVPLG